MMYDVGIYTNVLTRLYTVDTGKELFVLNKTYSRTKITKDKIVIDEVIMTILNYIRLVPDETVQKATSKWHKTDGKSTYFMVHVYQSIFGVF